MGKIYCLGYQNSINPAVISDLEKKLDYAFLLLVQEGTT
jgi:hypothetical protein